MSAIFYIQCTSFFTPELPHRHHEVLLPMDVTYDNLIHTTFHGFASFAVISTIANYGWLHVSAGKFFMAATALSPARGHPLISLPVTKCLCATNPSCLPRELI